MSVDFSCPRCNKAFRTSEANIGRLTRCSQCGGMVRVPPPETAAVEPDAEAVPLPADVPVSWPPIAPGSLPLVGVAAAVSSEVAPPPPRQVDVPAASPPSAAPSVVPLAPHELRPPAEDYHGEPTRTPRQFYRELISALWWPLWKLPRMMGMALLFIIMGIGVVIGAYALAVVFWPLSVLWIVAAQTYMAGVLVGAMRGVVGAAAVDLPNLNLAVEWRITDAMRRAFCLWWFWWLAPVGLVGLIASAGMLVTWTWDPLVGQSVQWICLAAGVLLTVPMPMALIGLSSDYEWSSLNVARVFRSIGRTAGPYMALWAFSAAAMALYATATYFVASWQLPSELDRVPLLGLLTWLLKPVLSYGLAMCGALAFARAAGLFASVYRGKLDFSL